MAAQIPIRAPTLEERQNLLPLASRGWANTEEVPEGMWLADIVGQVPRELHGTFFRNGPGFNVVYGTQLSHPIDGDGVVAALSFADGKVHFRSRFVQTKTHVEEAQAKKMLYNGNMGSRAPQDTVRPGWRDPAHTNVFHWGSRLLACHEYALPHALNPTSLETLGADTLNGNLELKVVSAHYRYDADKDVLVCVAFKTANKPNTFPRVSFYEFNRDMELKHSVRMDLEAANYAHDFCLTPNWFVLHVTPFIDTRPETLKEIQKRKLFPGETMKYVQGLPSQFCLIQRNPVGNSPPTVLRFDVDPFHIYHYVNARESPENNGIVTFTACCLPVGFTMEWQHHAFLANTGDAPGVMHSFIISPNEGSIVHTKVKGLETTSCEFPSANQYRHVPRSLGVKTDIFYLMASQPSIALPFTDVVKYNAGTGAVSRWHSPGVVGEPCFCPRLGRASAWYGDEDDGWVVVQVFMYKENRVEFVVLDAKKIHSGPVCRIKLPVHLSIGFHGTYSELVLF